MGNAAVLILKHLLSLEWKLVREPNEYKRKYAVNADLKGAASHRTCSPSTHLSLYMMCKHIHPSDCKRKWKNHAKMSWRSKMDTPLPEGPSQILMVLIKSELRACSLRNLEKVGEHTLFPETENMMNMNSKFTLVCQRDWDFFCFCFLFHPQH